MISTVIPVLNEADSLEELYAELDAVAREHGYKLDVVFVDDGSTDRSWQVIRRLRTMIRACMGFGSGGILARRRR